MYLINHNIVWFARFMFTFVRLNIPKLMRPCLSKKAWILSTKAVSELYGLSTWATQFSPTSCCLGFWSHSWSWNNWQLLDVFSDMAISNYKAIPDMQVNFLGLRRTLGNVGKASSFIRSKFVIRQTTLESSTVQAWELNLDIEIISLVFIFKLTF